MISYWGISMESGGFPCAEWAGQLFQAWRESESPRQVEQSGQLEQVTGPGAETGVETQKQSSEQRGSAGRATIGQEALDRPRLLGNHGIGACGLSGWAGTRPLGPLGHWAG
jgi:hypothetical protein